MFASYAFAKNNETILLTLFETSFFELQKHGEWEFLPPPPPRANFCSRAAVMFKHGQ